jgi:two-component system NarL family response regulator
MSDTTHNQRTVVIVEDQPMLLRNLADILDSSGDFTVVGAFGTAEKALAAPQTGTADLLIVDIDLPGRSGIELIREIKARVPDKEILVWTICEDRDTVFAALQAGASGYMLKGASVREMLEAIRVQFMGGAPMSPTIARQVIESFQRSRASDIEQSEPLTQREREILRLIARGLTYKEIAAEMQISPHTVHTHIRKIYEKLHARNRSEMLDRAKALGIVSQW